jgi:hypothetical protein
VKSAHVGTASFTDALAKSDRSMGFRFPGIQIFAAMSIKP